jgi:hypothetical protein
MNHKAVYRRAPATPGLLKKCDKKICDKKLVQQKFTNKYGEKYIYKKN